MSVITLTQLYDFLKDKLGKETAENLTNFIEHKIKDQVETKSQMLATRDDLRKEVSMLERKIGETKVDLIKWMFAFWVTIVLMFIGLYIKN